MKADRYPPVEDGEWVEPRRDGFEVACCHCGLVHKVQIRLVRKGNGRRVQFRVWRQPRRARR